LQWARRAIAERDFSAAHRWNDVADWLSYRDPASALLAARIARSEGAERQMQAELSRARQWGAAPFLVRREEILALAQSGHLDGIEEELRQHLAVAGGDETDISEAYANGLAAQGRFVDALQVFEAWRRDFPDDPRPDHRMGRIQEHQQLYGEAEASYRRSIARNGRFYPSRFSLGRVLMHQRRADAAIEQYRACLMMPAPAAAEVELAVAYKSQGEIDEARALLQRVLAATPEELAASYRALEERPETFRAAAEYGRLEADAGNYEVAEHWLRKALAANPQDSQTRYALALSLRGLGRTEAAAKEFNQVNATRAAMDAAGGLNARIQRNPGDLDARLQLGKLVLEHESERTGLYWIRSIFAYDPEYRPAHEFLSRYFASRADREPEYAGLALFHERQSGRTKQSTTPPTAGPQP
jgi:tetratricopeptide (TPR) repeat protein